MEHTIILSSEQVQEILDILNRVMDEYDEDVDCSLTEPFEDAIEETWFVPGGCIYELAKEVK